MNRLVFPGSFDPPTLGHQDLIRRASKLCDELIAAVLVNGNKRSIFTVEERLSMLRLMTQDLPNVKVLSFDGLLVDFLHKTQAAAVIRGLRKSADYEYEAEMAVINRRLDPSCETLFLQAKPELAHISSSLVRELAGFGRAYDAFVPAECLPVLEEGFKRNRTARS